MSSVTLPDRNALQLILAEKINRLSTSTERIDWDDLILDVFHEVYGKGGKEELEESNRHKKVEVMSLLKAVIENPSVKNGSLLKESLEEKKAARKLVKTSGIYCGGISGLTTTSESANAFPGTTL
ncbi:hypothetical protein RUND412_008520 [Rhizina undulata]